MQFGPILLAATTSTTTTSPEPGTLEYACRVNDSALCHDVWNLTHNSDIASVVDVTSLVISILVILVIAFVVLRLVRRAIKRTVAGLQGERIQRGVGNIRKRTPSALLDTGQTSSVRRAQRAETIGALLRSASTVVIVLIAGLAILKQLAFPIGTFVAGASIATAALAFGAQNIVRDFLAGFFIVVEDQYGVGDVIDAGEASGLVESVSLRITRLRDVDGTLWHVPNGEIKRVGNKSQQWSRAVMDFRVAIDSDIPKAISAIKLAADDLWRDPDHSGFILEEPQVWGPEEVSPTGILLKLVVKTKPLEQWQISRTLRGRVKAELDRVGVRIATPPMGTTEPN